MYLMPFHVVINLLKLSSYFM